VEKQGKRGGWEDKKVIAGTPGAPRKQVIFWNNWTREDKMVHVHLLLWNARE
jgi:hypothetical protein